MIPHFALLALLSGGAAAPGSDPRALYDVTAYRIELRVDPSQKTIAGWTLVEGKVSGSELGVVQLDMHSQLTADEVRLASAPIEDCDPTQGREIDFEHAGQSLNCTLPDTLARGTGFALAIRYHGSPQSQNDFDGFHWRTTPSGKPWVCTSMQGTGAFYWFPCKSSYYHPEDKPERLSLAATVPKGLYAVSNGRLVERRAVDDGWERFLWRHDYPLMTYSITLDVAPYVVVESQLELEGLSKPLPFLYYVLPEDREKADLQFTDVKPLLAAYSKAFGPYPFPESKFALVETNFWGMEHSTAVAYGSSFPAWCEKTGTKDKWARRNAMFDYILVHEVAHEWWGNGVSAADWADFWLHEGFATYAEGVYVEFVKGAKPADEYWKRARMFIDKRGSLDRGKGSDSGRAYANILYNKGAWVLHTLRTFVANDDAWWKTLRDFNLEFRYRNATTADFQRVLERNTQADWGRFFDEWFHGSGYPRLEGKVTVGAGGLEIAATSSGTDETTFHVPLDLEWFEQDQKVQRRVMLEPGPTELSIPTTAPPRDVHITSLERLLGSYDVRVVASER